MRPTNFQNVAGHSARFSQRHQAVRYIYSGVLTGLIVLIMPTGVAAQISPNPKPIVQQTPSPAEAGLAIEQDMNTMGIPGDHAGYRFLATEPVEVVLSARAAGQTEVIVSDAFTNGQTVVFGYRVLVPNLKEAPQSNVCEICVGWVTEKFEAGVNKHNSLKKENRLVFPMHLGGGVETGSFNRNYHPPVPSTTRLLRYHDGDTNHQDRFSITVEFRKPRQSYSSE